MKKISILSLLWVLLSGSVYSQSYYFDASQLWGASNRARMEGAVFLPGGDRVYGIASKSVTNLIFVRETPAGNIVWAKEIQTGLSPALVKLYIAEMKLSKTDTLIYVTIGDALTKGLDVLLKMGTANGYVHYMKRYTSNVFAPGSTLIEINNGDLIYASAASIGQGNFMKKYDAAGNQLWVKSFPAPGSYSDCRGVVEENNGTYTFLSRQYNGSQYDLVAVNIDAAGTINWSYQIGHNTYNFFITDLIKIGNYYYIAAHQNNYYNSILKCDQNFNVIDNRNYYVQLNNQMAYSMKLINLQNGNFILSGYDRFLDGDVNYLEGLIVKLDTSLNVVWMKNTTSKCALQQTAAYEESLIAYDVDANGNLLMGGITRQYSPLYVVADSSGNDYCKLINTTNINTDTLSGFTTTPVALSSSLSSISTGTAFSVVNFNFPQRITSCPSVSVTACDSYTSPGGFTWNTSGIYTDHIPLSGYNGICDSLVIVNLTINTVDTTVTNNTPTLSSNQAGATYQWLDCNNNYAAIPGETSQSFTATANGNYAVAVTFNGCTDTSACIQISNVGVNTVSTVTSKIKIYPNPFSTKTTLQFGNFYTNATLTLSNIFGQTVKEIKNIKGTEVTLEKNNLPSGLYFVRLTQDNKIITADKLIITD